MLQFILTAGAVVGIVRLLEKHQQQVTGATAFRATISDAATYYTLNASIITGLIQRESSFNPDAVGKAGEIGLGQFKQVALDDIRANIGFRKASNVKELFDPTKAIYATAAYLALNRRRFGNMLDAIRAYNVGPGDAAKDKSAGAGYLADVLSNAGVDLLYTTLDPQTKGGA